MTYIRGGHVTGKTARHTFDDINAWYTNLSIKDMRETLLDGCTEEEFNERKIVYECKAGDALIFPQTTPHRSLTNFTDKTRWSLDYRYHASDTPGLENPLDWFYGVKDSIPFPHTHWIGVINLVRWNIPRIPGNFVDLIKASGTSVRSNSE